MKALKKDLQSIVKGLKALTQKIEKVTGKLDKIGRAKTARKPKPKPRAKAAKKKVAKKPAKATAIDTVLTLINRSRKGIDTAALRKKTGFEGRKIRDVIYRLKKQGDIKSIRTGVYVKK